MAENQKSVDGIIEKLALIADAVEQLFPEGKSAIAFELKHEDFKKVQSNFKSMDSHFNQFKVEIANTEFMFLLDKSSTSEEDKTLESLSRQG